MPIVKSTGSFRQKKSNTYVFVIRDVVSNTCADHIAARFANKMETGRSERI